MTMILLLCIVLTTQLSSGACDAGKNIFILAGQSNMAGRGGVTGGKWDGNVPPECKPNRSILRFSAECRWEGAHEPLHADIDVGKTCGTGPGMAFANEVLRAKGPGIGVAGLVPCAVGGTRIREWARGTRLYGELVRRAREAVRQGGMIRGVLWYQGESDTVKKEDAEAYKGNFERLISDLRSGLNIPNLPVIQVALASGEGQFIDIVRKAQLSVNLPNVKCVDAKGLRLKEDHLHLTTMSQVHLGIKKWSWVCTHTDEFISSQYSDILALCKWAMGFQEPSNLGYSFHSMIFTGFPTWITHPLVKNTVVADFRADVKAMSLRTLCCQKRVIYVGTEETKVVETVDYRKPAGGETKKEDVEVVHEIQHGEKPAGGTVFGDAAATVANTFQSAKDAISGIGKDKTPEDKTPKDKTHETKE